MKFVIRAALTFMRLFTLLQLASALNEEFEKKLSSASAKAEEAITSIYNEWEVGKYPKFLKSCYMHKVSWELLKLKFQKKIVDAAESSAGKSNFVISFLGSSVTAGHDSLFNASFPVIVGELMRPALSLLDVELDSRNVALGNNPCTPYDVCVKYFAGLDADVVHWEQTFFCQGQPIIEQFVRQASFMPSRPIVVFAESQTAHWKEIDCAGVPTEYTPNDEEKGLLKAAPMQLVSEINRDEFHRTWATFHEYPKLYHAAGIQTFQHTKEADYKCKGPYISTWAKGAASWHPSVIAHRLRASHHSYFWLLIWIDAIKDLQSMVSHRNLDAIQKDIDHHLEKLYEQPIKDPQHKTPFPDSPQCFSDYEPRPVREASLKKVVMRGLADPEGGPNARGWKFSIYEDLVSRSLVEKSLKMGYLDFKWMLYGNKDSGPLSISILTHEDGPIFICETPGIWGSLPKGFDHLWNGVVDMYMTYNVADKENFDFDLVKAVKFNIFHEKSLEICAQVRSSQNETVVPQGAHVLTVVPSSDTKAILAWMITSP